MISLRLQTILLLALCAAFACCTLLGSLSFVTAFRDYRDLQRSGLELSRFHAVLEAAHAVSAERGSANSAMGPADGEAAKNLEKLHAKRAEHDRLLAALRDRFRDDIARSDEISDFLAALSQRLVEGRRAVDAVVATPMENRAGPDVIHAIEKMFLAADAAKALRDRIGNTIIHLTPQISTDIILGMAAGSMREDGGRLGSVVVMMLMADPQEDVRLLPKLQKSVGELSELRSIMRNYASAFFRDQSIQKAIADVDVTYFGASLPFALRVSENEARTNAMSAAAFTEAYVPGMKNVESLRQLIIRTSAEKLNALQFAALTSLVSSTVLLATILLILVVVALVFKRSLFNPLLVVRGQILAIADGDLSEPERQGSMSSEVGDMFEGLGVLRQQQRHKRELQDEQQRLSQRLKELAEIDPLTGIMNRRAIATHADRIIPEADAAGRWLAVLLIDIDHFKTINDTYGHGIGDTVLQTVAQEFRGLLQPGDAIARFGGEEFLILLDNAVDDRGVVVAEALRAHLEAFDMHREFTLRVTASFGVAVRQPRSKKSWEDMVQNADRRLYAAKRGGRNQVRFVDEPRMDDGIHGKLQPLQRLSSDGRISDGP